MASVRSLDNALEVDVAGTPTKITDDLGVTQIPDNGRIIRNLIHGADTVMSHITHFYHLAALDYVDVSSLGATFSPTYTGTGAGLLPSTVTNVLGASIVGNYVKGLSVRRKAHTMSAILSGRHPIQNAIVAGGVTTLATASDMVLFNSLLTEIRDFVNTAYIPDVVTVASVVGAAGGGLWLVGTDPSNVLSYGEFPIQSGTGAEQLLLSRGLATNFGAAAYYTGSGPSALLDQVVEYVGYSYYSSPSGLNPVNGQTTADVTKVNNGTQYSWLKAPRVKDPLGGNPLVCEVGPLARVAASYLVTNPATAPNSASWPTALWTLPASYTITNLAAGALSALPGVTVAKLFSVLGRHATRALECKFVADAMSTWAGQISGAALTNPVYVYAKLPVKPKIGKGWAEAPRGALGHWIAIEKKKIVNYQCVVPSTWNHSPKDDLGQNGPAEAALKGENVGTSSTDMQVVNILRIVHPYDFCIACAVHMVRPDGSTIAKFKMELDGKTTILPHDAEI